jgi:hypothetical protein
MLAFAPNPLLLAFALPLVAAAWTRDSLCQPEDRDAFIAVARARTAR